MFILGLSTMVWHMFIVKKLSSAAFLMDKVMFLIIFVISFLVDIFGPPESTPPNISIGSAIFAGLTVCLTHR